MSNVGVAAGTQFQPDNHNCPSDDLLLLVFHFFPILFENSHFVAIDLDPRKGTEQMEDAVIW